MTTNRLTGLYEKLAVMERIPLMVAAAGRRDESEHERLIASSPRKVWHFADHHLAEIHLHVLALIYVSEQLDGIGSYFMALNELSKEQNDDYMLLALTSAYLVVAHAQGWNQFCSQLGIDGAVLARLNHNGTLLSLCEQQMTRVAPTCDELLGYLQQVGITATTLTTPDSICISWRALYDQISNERNSHDR